MILRFTLNCTVINPFTKWGLKQNPFPQFGKAELNAAMMQLNSLGGEPLMGMEDIATRLKGWDPEFIEACQDRFTPGTMVHCEVTIPDEFLPEHLRGL